MEPNQSNRKTHHHERNQESRIRKQGKFEIIENLTVKFKKISQQVLEMFGSGTAAVVSPIERIFYMGDNLLVPTMDNSNSFWKQCLKTLTDIQYGRVKHPWAMEIE